MRVLLVDYSVGFGGATKSISLVLRQLHQVEVTVLTCQDTTQCALWYPQKKVIGFRRYFNYVFLARARRKLEKVFGVPGLKLVALADRVYSLFGLFGVIWIILRARIELVHLNNGAGPEEVLWAAKLLGLPVVVHLRGIPDGKPERVVLPQRSRIVAVSPSVLQAHEELEFSSDEASVVWDPVDLKLFDECAGDRAHVRRMLGFSETDVAVGIFGRLIRLKGQLEFARAALRLLEEGYPLRPVIVGAAGDFGDGYAERVKALIQGTAHFDRFCFVGYQEEPAPYFHAMDVVVHFSVEPEGLGMVIPEAMAAGKPVIAARSGGPSDIIENNVDGILVPYRDEESLYRELRSLVADGQRREVLSRKAREKASRDFSIEAAASAMSKIYGDLHQMGGRGHLRK